MKTAHRKASQHKRQMMALHSNPVARAVHRAEHERTKAKANEEFCSQILTTRIKAMSADHGSDATELLASLAVAIGTPCEAGAREFGRDHPWVRQLHGALRTIQAMCLAGYRWDSTLAHALDRAIEVAIEHQDAINDETFTAAWLEANGFAGEILRHEVKHNSVIC